MDKDTYDNIAKIFNDPISLNTYFKEAEINRKKLAGQNHNLRADPFIVATTQIRDGNGALTSPIIGKDNLWDLVETLQKTQTVNETLVALYTSGIANQLPEQLLIQIDSLLQAQGLNSTNLDQIQIASYFLTAFGDYYSMRPLNLDKTLEYLYLQRVNIDKAKIKLAAKNLAEKKRSVQLLKPN